MTPFGSRGLTCCRGTGSSARFGAWRTRRRHRPRSVALRAASRRRRRCRPTLACTSGTVLSATQWRSRSPVTAACSAPTALFPVHPGRGPSYQPGEGTDQQSCLSCGAPGARVPSHEGHRRRHPAASPAATAVGRGSVRQSGPCVRPARVHHAGARLKARLFGRGAFASHGPVVPVGSGVCPCARGHPSDRQPHGTGRGTHLRCLGRTDNPTTRNRHRTTVPSSQSLTSIQFNS